MSYTGDLIRKYRKELGFTQKYLGELCGIADSNIRKYENGRQNPKFETVQKIAKALNKEPAAFYAIPAPIEKEADQKELEQQKLSDFPEDMRERINENFDKMNEIGQKRLVEYSDDIVEKYRKDSE